MKQHAALTLLPLLLTLALASTASARDCEGVTLPNAVTVEGTRLVLNGMGVREATVFNVNVYVAGLYLPGRTRDASQVLRTDQPTRLVMSFVREVERNDIVDAFRAGFRASSGATQAQIQRLVGFLPAAQEGTVLTFTYVPGTGLSVRVGNRVRGTIEGAEFAHAFLGIWLGSSPPNSGLKSGLLGGQCG